MITALKQFILSNLTVNQDATVRMTATIQNDYDETIEVSLDARYGTNPDDPYEWVFGWAEFRDILPGVGDYFVDSNAEEKGTFHAKCLIWGDVGYGWMLLDYLIKPNALTVL